MADRRALVAGNWKMHGLRGSLTEIDRVAGRCQDGAGCDVMICPSFTLLAPAIERAADSGLLIGAQDCHTAEQGAHTGDVSAAMLADIGAQAVIVGHSERRADHGETDALVRAKVEAAWASGLTAIVCIGETEGQRRYGVLEAVLARQIAGSLPDGATAANTVIAYEPVWAIGTGLVPTEDDVAHAHGFAREQLRARAGAGAAEAMRILYGGSVKPGNAASLMAVSDVDGALVGGASLKADDFLGIVAAYD